ncbi:MAG TPA: pyridoxal phosphate-dependent aminotransferase [Polyangia bacterium]|nr:pyridoxal phosphate-dependent aminotransferase [Polyangia bacterium]
MKIASRVTKMQPSLTLAVSAKANKLKAQGVDVVAFGVGEPDFDTPDHIKEAAVAAMKKGCGKYTAVSGTPELRAAAAAELNAAHGTKYAAENIIVSVGAKHSLFNLFMALLDDGDEVIVPSPCWVSYPEIVAMAGGKPVLVDTVPDDGYQLHYESLARAVTPKTRLIVLNSPCNPTGAVYDKNSMEAVARVLRENKDVFAVTDDIYRRLTYGVEWLSLPRLAPDVADRVILVDGVSKSYAMTGWRIGFTAGPTALVKAMDTLQGQSTTNPAAVAQAAALAAITGPQESVTAMHAEFDKRRRAMVEGLRAIPKVKLHEPRGAFYCFPDLGAYVGGKIKDDVALAEYILEKGRVAVVPGTGFFAPGFVRLSYATSMANVTEGVRRIAEALAQL